MNWFCFLNAYSQGLSGGDACFLNFGKFANTNHELTIITSGLGKELCLKEGINSKFIITTKEKIFRGIYLTYLKRIFHAITKTHPSMDCLLYSSSDSPPDVIPPFIFKALSPKMFWVQKIFHVIPKRQGIRKVVQKLDFFLIKHFSDLIIVDSLGLKEELQKKFNFPKDKVAFVRPGIDLKYINYVPPWPNKFEAIFVGQLRRSKGVFDLIPIWKKVTNVIPSAKLAIVGQDIQENLTKLKKQIGGQNLSENIIFFGFVPKGVPYSLMKSSRVLLLPSREEGFGMVLAEALACGIRAVAYKQPAFGEHFSNEIQTISGGNSNLFAKSVISALSSPHDEVKKSDRIFFAQKFNLTESIEKEVILIENALKKSIS